MHFPHTIHILDSSLFIEFYIVHLFYLLYRKLLSFAYHLYYNYIKTHFLFYSTPRNSESDSESSSKDYEIISSSEVQNVADN